MKDIKNKKKDIIPEEFDSCEEAGKFWDTHDSTDYLDQMTPVKVDSRLEKRRFEIEIESDVQKALSERAELEHVTATKLANELLRKELKAG